jgi:predicted negative regulator of RcsB-dependent stress response
MSHHEEEQIETLKRFWQDYGRAITVGVVLALAGLTSWELWQNHKLDQSTKATELFQKFSEGMQRNQFNTPSKDADVELLKQAKTIKQDYENTPYALSASLLLARHAVDNEDFPEAEKQLRWAADHKPDKATRFLISVRLARVLLQQKRYDDALAVLAKEDNESFIPTIAELQGDVYVAQGQRELAKTAYLKAANALVARGQPLSALELKLADVGAAAPEKKTDSKKGS